MQHRYVIILHVIYLCAIILGCGILWLFWFFSFGDDTIPPETKRYTEWVYIDSNHADAQSVRSNTDGVFSFMTDNHAVANYMWLHAVQIVPNHYYLISGSGCGYYLQNMWFEPVPEKIPPLYWISGGCVMFFLAFVSFIIWLHKRKRKADVWPTLEYYQILNCPAVQEIPESQDVIFADDESDETGLYKPLY